MPLPLNARIAGSDARALAPEITALIEKGLGRRYAFPGNVRELEQTVRRILLTGGCARDERRTAAKRDVLASALHDTTISAEALVQRYCAALYARNPSYVEVARITGLDRRTVKKHLARS